jgi:predicted RNA binding protein YcfA (HicA-like mRNA interferase family)
MIDYSKLRSITARHLITALEADGFTLNRQKGSHRHFKHPDGPTRNTLLPPCL